MKYNNKEQCHRVNSAFELITDDKEKIKELNKKVDLALEIRDKYDAREIKEVPEDVLSNILVGKLSKVSIEQMESILK